MHNETSLLSVTKQRILTKGKQKDEVAKAKRTQDKWDKEINLEIVK